MFGFVTYFSMPTKNILYFQTKTVKQIEKRTLNLRSRNNLPDKTSTPESILTSSPLQTNNVEMPIRGALHDIISKEPLHPLLLSSNVSLSYIYTQNLQKSNERREYVWFGIYI